MHPLCFECANYQGRDPDQKLEGGAPLVLYCKAFPRGGPGIPKEILDGEVDHRLEAYPGDQGIRFSRGDS